MKVLSGSYLCRLTFRSRRLATNVDCLLGLVRAVTMRLKSASQPEERVGGQGDDQYHGQQLHELICASGFTWLEARDDRDANRGFNVEQLSSIRHESMARVQLCVPLP